MDEYDGTAQGRCLQDDFAQELTDSEWISLFEVFEEFGEEEGHYDGYGTNEKA